MKSSTTVGPILAVLVATVLMICCSGAATIEGVDQLLESINQLPEVVPGIFYGQFKLTDPYTAKQCDGTRQSACSSCTEIKTCVLADATMDSSNPSQACPKNNQFCSMGASPFGAVCQKTPDTSVTACASAAPDFKCTGMGYYPDAYTCQYYYICAGAGKTPDFYTCPDGYRFSSKTKACVLSNAPCPTFTCKADDPSLVYQAHMYDTQYYVYCQFDTTTSPPSVTNTYVFSCGDGASYNPTTGRCVYTCTKEGLFPSTVYLSQYYQCARSGNKLVYTEKVCPSGKIFAVDRCVTDPNATSSSSSGTGTSGTGTSGTGTSGTGTSGTGTSGTGTSGTGTSGR